MKRRDRKRITIPIVVLCLSVAATFFYVREGYRETEATILNQMIQDLTASYRIRQIVGAVVMYAMGFWAAYPFCINMKDTGWAYLLAMPTGNALWGVASSLLLFTGVPYNRYTMFAVTAFLMAGLTIRFREDYAEIAWGDMAGALVIAFSISLMAASGVFAKFTSSDSYYFVMQYGQLIAKQGKLLSDIVGTYMTWTGITPALTSAFAAMGGYENIYAIHYLLIFSMYGFIALLVYITACKYYGKAVSLAFAVAALVTLGVIPGVSYLNMWIIANTYFMVYIVLLMMLPAAAGGKVDNRLLCLMSLMVVWLALSRPETALVMSFLVICISLSGVTKKQMTALHGPMCMFQLLFFGKILYEYAIGGRQANDKMLTPGTAVIILVALGLAEIYILLYDVKWVCFIRKHLAAFALSALLVSCLGLGLMDRGKFSNNLNAVAGNVKDWYWGYVPAVILVLELLKTCFRCRNHYYDLIVWGFILCNFAVCMGRPHGLRLGIGDSYNRICMSILPLYVVSTVLTFVAYFGKEREKNVIN